MSPQPEFTCPTPEELGKLLNGYEVTALISSGIRGALYQATQMSLDRKVTIKVLPPEIGHNSRLRQAFETEAKVMARLNNPHLVDVFDFGDIQGMLYIIMEHVPGRSLHETTHGLRVDQKESARLVADLCHGLEHAHQAGIVHRALNPHNVLINRDAQAKIVDFGIATLTGINTAEETSRYNAPETFQQGSHVDAKADIYSAGIILYELIVGKLPSNPYIAPSQARNCRPEIDEIIYRAIQPDPGQRYASASEMAATIENLLEKMGTAPTQEIIKTMMTAVPATGVARRPVSPIYTPQPASNSSAIVVTVLTIAIVVGVAGLIIKTSSDTPEPTKQPPVTQAPKAKPATPEKPQAKPKKPKNRNKKNREIVRNKPPVVAIPEPTPADPVIDKEVIVPSTPDKPDPTPPVKPAPPEFDIAAWLEKARAFMKNKAKYVLADYDKSLLANIGSFERDVKRITRKLDRNIRKPVEFAVEEAFEKFRVNGRLPEQTDEDTPEQIKNLYSIALDDQKKVDAKFLGKFTELRITYIQGLDKQISHLKNEGNDEHAESLEEEISLTQKDMDRFVRILRGQDPDPEEEPEEDDKKDKDK